MKPLAVDTEVPGLAARRGLKPFMVTTCDDSGRAKCWEWPVDLFSRKVDVNGIDLIEIRDHFAGKDLIFHHGQFDLRIFANAGLIIHTPHWSVPVPPEVKHVVPVYVNSINDTLFLSHLADSRGVYRLRGNEVKSTHALKDLCLVRLNVSDGDEIALKKAVHRARIAAKKKGYTIGTEPGHDYWLPRALDPKNKLCREYAIHDVRERTMLLFLTCREILQQDGTWDMYLEERHLLPIYYMMEETGLRLSPENFDGQRSYHKTKMSEYDYIMWDLANSSGVKDLNVNSPKQLTKLLYDVWGLPVTKRTEKSGAASTDASTLSYLCDEAVHLLDDSNPYKDYAKEFLECLVGVRGENEDGQRVVLRPGYRQHVKALGYLDSYDARKINGKLHQTIHPVGTGTTRISSSDPNAMNVSKKVIEGASIRAAFGPDKGHIWVSIDYEQLELRIFAALSQDGALQQAFDDGHDFHGYVASKIFKKPPHKITSEERRIAKNTNFAMIYGGSPGKVDAAAGMTGAYESFSKQFPSARKFMDSTIHEVRENGFIPTADGYPLWPPAAEPFKALDYRVQGTAGRIIKLAMRWLCYGYRMEDWHTERFQPTKDQKPIVNWRDILLLLQIHDELVFDIDTTKRTRNDVVRIIRSIEATMEAAGAALGITTPVDTKIHAANWQTGVKVRKYQQGI